MYKVASSVTSRYVIIGKLLYSVITIDGTENRHTAELVEHAGTFRSVKLATQGMTYPRKMFQADVTSVRTELHGRVIGAPAF
jgi:hypothetical protein